MQEKKRNIRLLLVDDEVEFLSATAAALARRAIDVEAARNGLEALARLSREPYDVAVVDLKMPGMTGDVLAREMKKNWPKMPVILMTAFGDSKLVGQLSKDKVYYYLRKPCDIEILASVARQAVDDEWRRWIRRLKFG
jgi:DNA-binding NtrC family response regulator